MSKLGDRLRRHPREARAVHTDGRWWTYGELVDAATDLGARLAIGPGDVVAITAERGIEAVQAVVAAMLAGAVTAVAPPGSLASLRPKVVVPAQPIDWEPLARDPRTALVIFTSGATATPKAVVWSEARLAFDLATAAPSPASAPAGIAAPLSTSFGLKDLIQTLDRGQSAVLIGAPFPWALEEAINLGIDRINLTPTHAQLALATSVPLGSLRQVLLGAAPVAPPVIDALAARMTAARIGRIYGTTETGAISVQWHHARSRKRHTVGRPLPRRGVTIRDHAGRVLPPETWGNVVVEVPVWDEPDGYLDAPLALARRFTNARHWTGDRGKLDADGYLVLGARASELIKVGGRSTSAPAIERVLAGLAAELAVVGSPDLLLGEVPAAVYVPGPATELAVLVAAAQTGLRPDEQPRCWLAVRELPRVGLGKLDRRALAASVARWTSAFRTTVALDFDVLPARELDEQHVVADLGPGSGTLRRLALVERATGTVVARGTIEARSEPVADGPPAFVAALRELATLLP